MHMHTTPLRCLRSLPHSLSITDTALQNAKGHIPLVLVLTAKFSKGYYFSKEIISQLGSSGLDKSVPNARG